MSNEESKYLTDPAFKENILNYLRVYINNIANHIRQNPKPYQEKLDNGTIHTVNWDEPIYEKEILKPPNYSFACPYCRESKDFRYFVYIFLDDNKIIDRCEAKADLNRGWKIILNSEYVACRAEFHFICNSNEKDGCHNRQYVCYGHYIDIDIPESPFKNLYDKRYCIGDILINPHKYENI